MIAILIVAVIIITAAISSAKATAPGHPTRHATPPDGHPAADANKGNHTFYNSTAGAFQSACPETQPPCELSHIAPDYCTTMPPDTACYPKGGGRPTCCTPTMANSMGPLFNCPETMPPCELHLVVTANGTYLTVNETTYVLTASDNNSTFMQPVGGSYCTWAPDYSCYPNGRPGCCQGQSQGNAVCPEAKPPCELPQSATNPTMPMLGADYCTWGFDHNCYTEGKPACCMGMTEAACPKERPPCDVDGAGYCTWTPDPGCYLQGKPACCFNGKENCPEDPPPCDIVDVYTTTTTTTATEPFTTTTSTTEAPPNPFPPTIPTGPMPQTGGPAYCMGPANPACYANQGFPSCCGPPITCTETTSPPCDLDVVGNTVVSTLPTVFVPNPAVDASTPTIPAEEIQLVGQGPPSLDFLGNMPKCNEAIPSEYPNNIIPAEVIAAFLGEQASQTMAPMVVHDVRVHKICTTCKEINRVVSSRAFADEVLPYCARGKFAYGRTMSGLLFEPVDRATGMPIAGKVATTIYNTPTSPNPFEAASTTWPANVATNPTNPGLLGLFTASSGTYTLVPDGLGNGEDWMGTRSYMVKDYYMASAVPLFLKMRDYVVGSTTGNDVSGGDGSGGSGVTSCTQLDKRVNIMGYSEGGYATIAIARGTTGGDGSGGSGVTSCTQLDKRVNIMGYSEGGYATIAIARGIDMLDDAYVHTFTGVGGAPIHLSGVQMTKAAVAMNKGTFKMPQYFARLSNAYSSTNIDLVNTNLQNATSNQNLTSYEYLDPNDPTKNVWEWAKMGLTYEQMVPYLPMPFTDMFNQNLLALILRAYEAGNYDPCNSEFKSEYDVDNLCEALLDNDLKNVLENEIDYPVTICHSPDDEVIYYSNVPDTTLYDHLTMIEDVPGVGDSIMVFGNHSTAGAICTMAFLYPFVTPPEFSEARSVLPVDDPDGVCAGATTTGTSSTAVPGVGSATTLPTSTSTSDGEDAKSPTSAPTDTEEEPLSAASVVSYSLVASVVLGSVSLAFGW
eukprot:CAMPEP_0183743126 /NCGR_PEP_ID=MMETSP0737-20130205/65056_1 /TAXON_ID=385413 /ORGANISM="Thalassiosira miniscula, Strain CCMP1093" /LENGTH=1012 /DNA_ID=CAMNT_0025978733 /DNA_START=189 /DNA_END=3226 /DNA_ORIENTATION=-